MGDPLGAEAAFCRCLAFLRRGVVTGKDVGEVLGYFEEATGTVGLSLASGFRFAPKEVLRDLPPEWPRTHSEHAAHDPSASWLDHQGPFAIYSVARETRPVDWKRNPLVVEFTRAGFGDGAIARIGTPGQWLYLAAYRPRPLPPFEDLALARMTALLPWMDLAFSSSIAQRALSSPRDESFASALERLGAYVVIEAGQESTWSAAAIRLCTGSFDGFGPRGRRRVEKALERARTRFLAGEGPRVVHLRSDLVAELALVPRPGGAAALVACLKRARKTRDGGPLPFEELLSPRQRDVARRAASGASIPAIARALETSSEAVKQHVREAYRRLGVGSRVELAALYEQSSRMIVR